MFRLWPTNDPRCRRHTESRLDNHMEDDDLNRTSGPVRHSEPGHAAKRSNKDPTCMYSSKSQLCSKRDSRTRSCVLSLGMLAPTRVRVFQAHGCAPGVVSIKCCATEKHRQRHDAHRKIERKKRAKKKRRGKKRKRSNAAFAVQEHKSPSLHLLVRPFHV